ncbi:unnamed protein product [Trifolium pratense]|uniref:Uncharacterized protein n=1 Tax=Trifolium pratense TaxID=57577 RepID=A0ACB0JAN9_TRIPR|nr:unnamed protein product [Trifolium pratense]
MHSCSIHQRYLSDFVIYESCRNGSSLQSKAPSEKYTGKFCFGLKGAPSSSLSSFLYFISFNSKVIPIDNIIANTLNYEFLMKFSILVLV